MISAYNVNPPFEKIIEQIGSAANFSDFGNVPYTPEKVASEDYYLIFATGSFTDDFSLWNAEADAYKTCKNLKLLFAKEYRTWCDTQHSSDGTHFPSSNALE